MRSVLLLFVIATVAYGTIKIQKPLNTAIVHGLLCTPCKDLVESAEHKGEDELKEYLEKEISSVCAHLGAFKSICEHELDKEVDQLVTLIEEGLPPDQVCKKADFC